MSCSAAMAAWVPALSVGARCAQQLLPGIFIQAEQIIRDFTTLLEIQAGLQTIENCKRARKMVRPDVTVRTAVI